MFLQRCGVTDGAGLCCALAIEALTWPSLSSHPDGHNSCLSSPLRTPADDCDRHPPWQSKIPDWLSPNCINWQSETKRDCSPFQIERNDTSHERRWESYCPRYLATKKCASWCWVLTQLAKQVSFRKALQFQAAWNLQSLCLDDHLKSWSLYCRRTKGDLYQRRLSWQSLPWTCQNPTKYWPPHFLATRPNGLGVCLIVFCKKYKKCSLAHSFEVTILSLVNPRIRAKYNNIFKRVVPKGLDHTLSVITVSLCVCNVESDPHWFQNGQWWSLTIFEPMRFRFHIAQT